jgi:hypothetical protein
LGFLQMAGWVAIAEDICINQLPPCNVSWINCNFIPTQIAESGSSRFSFVLFCTIYVITQLLHNSFIIDKNKENHIETAFES